MDVADRDTEETAALQRRESPDPPEGGDAILGAALEGLRRAAEEVEVERSVAETLQRSLLRERLPELPGLRLAAHYQPGSSEARVGGDWYDAIPLRDGRLALAIGDVVGRGVQAAARMAHLQSAVRAYALEGLDPVMVLGRMNSFVHELEGHGTATLLYVVVDLESETMRIASAGHPPPLLIDPGGGTSFAIASPGNPLGAVGLPFYEESVIALPIGSTLVLYTDGLVERPDRQLDAGLEELRVVAGADLPSDPARICGDLLAGLLEGGVARDDVAMLVTRIEPSPDVLSVTAPAAARSLAPVRGALGRWLRVNDVPDDVAFEIAVAVGEAAANAIAHAYPPGEAHFKLRARREGESVVVEVIDYGAWRPPRGGSRGRGLLLIDELTDTMDITRSNTGTTVTMTRRLDR